RDAPSRPRGQPLLGINGSTPGASSGTTATGDWDNVTANWSTDSTGAGATSTWTDGSTAVFAAGTNATGSYVVTVGGGVRNLGTASPDAAIIFEEGDVFINDTGGTLNLVT